MNKYLAKSNPQETIQEHTDNLLRNYDILKSLYPNLNVNWDILYQACLYHDFGKMNVKFQDKITTGRVQENEIPHGILSLAFINPMNLKSQGFSNSEIKILAHSIAYHHERDFTYENEILDQEIQLMEKEVSDFDYELVDQELTVRKLGAKYFSKKRIYQIDGEEVFFNYILVKGLLNRIDYAASGAIEVEKGNDFLLISMENLMSEWQKINSSSDWNDLQRYMINHRDENVIVIAQTGMGKTEAGLLWIGNNKGFFTLPLKTAINAMYDRITKQIVKEDTDDKVGLLHSDTYSEYLNNDLDEVDIDEYYNKTKQLSLPITVCTLDQIFDFVFRYRGFESKLATLSFAKVVIDEVQMYSSDLLAYLILGLTYITNIGGKFAILTATLPSLVEDLLRDEGVNFLPPKTFINNQRIRHSIKRVPTKINIEMIKTLYKNNKVLIICNTVKEAQRIYRELDMIYEKEDINLFHSNFIKRDRKQKEKNILRFGHKDSNVYGIWVTTQVVEASLDIDFDILITELSDLNGLFQRMGRCYRNREFEGDYNCYVFDGGEKECSGIGYVIDEEIFALSKDALKNIDGVIDEEDKMKMVSSLYTTEKLKNTKYYKLIKCNLNYVKSIEDHEKSKSDIKKMFRNIDSATAIPKEIFTKHKLEIKEYAEILSKGYDKSLSVEERKELKYRKTRARNSLMDFTLNTPQFRIYSNTFDTIVLNQYESIPILDCKYSEEIGIEYMKKDDLTQKNQSYDYSERFL
ncbi:CRISPR-associated helicase Cas3' [Alkalibaculum sp. M08DMB]|uniref:CRISPR-associated helicase Cas3 n=1 Tax=Alkalibaculum sporogenes TaxID=2655001 RepID=A0A6A7K4W5_9FIRM|nr:CRISPR-associated helicase Cas3' [Alkalibaculum sporogenes]MPW24509.1 CRISPR-associated helicase Cas3' [Alkalibaculum sporogenes]